ncbi:MAG: glucosyltransferase domain-containing protein [Acidobacteriota bacterium]|nr:glucosyltransferase domain-containing protein [Acidobacteriota bacterium]
MKSEHQHEAKAGKEKPGKSDRKKMGGETDEGGKSSEKDGAMDMSHGADEKPKGEAIIGENTVWWTLAGIIIGGASGWFIGLALGYGKFNLPGLAPLAAGDGLVAGFLFGSFFGSLFGLIGAIYGTLLDAEKMSSEMSDSKMSDEKMSGEMKHDEKKPEGEMKPEEMKHGATNHGKSSFVSQLPIYGSIALALFFAYTLYNIASRALGSGEASDQSNRVGWNLKNAVRVGGQMDAETYSNDLQIAFPATRAENSPKSVINLPDDWRVALAYTPLIARPNYAALLTADAQTENQRFSAAGNIAGETVSGNDAAQIAASVDDRLAQTSGNLSQNVLIVSSDADSRFALSAAAYAARTGTPVLFVGKDNVPAATVSALQKRNNQARIFVLGSTEIISANIFDQLKQFGTVQRIEREDFYTNAVRFAEFRDSNADFGWGRTGRNSRRFSPTNTILVNPERWQDAIAAAHLAARGKTGALLFTDKNKLPAVVDNYLWQQRPFFSMTPAEGPFNTVWVVGSFDRIDYKTQAWADYSQEIEQYMTQGDSAVSGYEAIGIGWILMSIACAIWILVHSIRQMPDLMTMMSAAWTIFALLLGPIAVWLYVASYNKREKMRRDGMTMWMRPVWLQAASATVMMFAFDMMLMCLAVFFLAYFFGFPIWRFNGSFYWLGSSMFLMMVFMYVFALVVMMLVFHTPMTMHEKKINSYGKAFMVGLPIMLITMTVESVGMMPTMWWQQMLFLPSMQMPTSDDITMWTTLLFAVFIGFLVVYPFNYSATNL